MRLSPLIAGESAPAVFTGMAVWIFAQLPGLRVWATFVGWASYDQSGAGRAALFTSSICIVSGVVMAWLVAVVVAAGVIPLSSPASSALAAAIASFIIVWVARCVAPVGLPNSISENGHRMGPLVLGESWHAFLHLDYFRRLSPRPGVNQPR